MARSESWPFYPEVKRAERRQGAFHIHRLGMELHAGKDALPAARLMAAFLEKQCGVQVEVWEEGESGLLLTIVQNEGQHASSDETDGQPSVPVPDHAEGYVCSVRPSGMRIEANTVRGFLYGWFTLEQWIQAWMQAAGSSESEQLEIPAVTVQDWPDLALRGHHLDFKGSVPRMSYVHETIARLARLKINTLLVEYEDQFPYAAIPHVHRPDGYTREEIGAMLQTAQAYGLDMIPVVQCIGHLDYVLEHEAYAHLREDGLTFQVCPSHPESLQLFGRMVDEVIRMHPSAKYIHIGADEALALGRCKRCQEWLQAEEGRSKEDLFLGYVKQAAAYVLQQGRTPIMWDDMFHSEKCLHRMSELPQGTAVSAWSYYETGRSNWVWWGGRYYTSKMWQMKDPGKIPQSYWLEDLPKAEQELIRKYWDGGEYPLYGKLNLPWIEAYREHVGEVFGVSCVRGADHTNQWFAQQEERVLNVAAWAAAAQAGGLNGVIASAWTRFYSMSPAIEPWETGWYPQWAHAGYAWHTAMTRDRLDAGWTQHFAGGDARLLQALRWIDQAAAARKPQYAQAAQRLLEACNPASEPLLRYVQGLRLAAQHGELALELETALRDVEWKLFGGRKKPLTSDVILQRGQRKLAEWLAKAEQWEREAILWCEPWMRREEAEEVVLTKLHPLKARAAAVMPQ